MEKVQVNASVKYEVLIGGGLLDTCGGLIKNVANPQVLAVITDDTVNGLYGERVVKSLNNSGFKVVKYVFPHGEESKSAENFVNILEFLAENHLTRSDMIVALGGGVVGDIAGFCASAYLRGIKFIQIPTTLLAAVDSSVGGKTAINLKAGKNLAGAFHQPSLVICDTDTFSTLPQDIYSCGVAEAIKYGVITDENLFAEMLGDYRKNIDKTVARCIEIKSRIVEEDEFDTGTRQLLNLGHTIGHAVEKCSNFAISHGHGVAIGMVIVARGTEKMGVCPKGTAQAIISALKKCDLPTECPYSAGELLSVALSDKKRSGSYITLVLPEKIGKCILKKIPTDSLEDFIEKGLLKNECFS